MNVSLSGNVAAPVQLVVLVEPECVEQAAAPGAHLSEVAVLFPSLKASSPRSSLPCQAATSARCLVRGED